MEVGAAKEFGDLRDYGVSEGGKALQSVGNPINHSLTWGFMLRPMYVPCRRAFRRAADPPQLSLSLALGVGHQPYALSIVGSAKLGRADAMPFCIEPD